MIPLYVLPAAMALRLTGEARYVMAVVRGQARPNPVSGFCWGLAPLVAFAAQLSHGVRPTEWMTLVIAIGPVAVVAAAVAKGGLRSTYLISTVAMVITLLSVRRDQDPDRHPSTVDVGWRHRRLA